MCWSIGRCVSWTRTADSLILNLTIAIEIAQAVAIGIMRHGELRILEEGIVILTASWRIVGHSGECNN